MPLELELLPELLLPALRTPRVDPGERLVGVALSPPLLLLPDPAGLTRVYPRPLTTTPSPPRESGEPGRALSPDEPDDDPPP